MKIKHTEDYRALRSAEYPPIADFADAMYWIARGDDAPMKRYFAAVEAVKQKFPKSN